MRSDPLTMRQKARGGGGECGVREDSNREGGGGRGVRDGQRYRELVIETDLR